MLANQTFSPDRLRRLSSPDRLRRLSSPDRLHRLSKATLAVALPLALLGWVPEPAWTIFAPAFAPAGDRGAQETWSASTARVRVATVAQETPALTVERSVEVAPGSRTRLPVRLAAGASTATLNILVHRLPDWMTLSEAERVGSGFWLIRSSKLDRVEMILSHGASAGPQTLAVALVSSGGEILSESRLTVTVTAPAQPAVSAPKPVAAAIAASKPATSSAQGAPLSAAAAAAAPPAASSGRTWQQLVGATSPANAAPARGEAKAPVIRTTPTGSTPASPTLGAAPAAAGPAPRAAGGVQVAQQGGAKTWEQLVGPGQGTSVPKSAPVARPAALAKPTPTRSERELLGYARHLVRECTTCHSLYGQDVGIPLMIGLSRDRFVETMGLYREGKRDNQAMRDIAKSLGDEETRALAIYLGRIRPPSPEEVAAQTRSQAQSAPQAVALAATKRTDAASEQRIGRWIQRARDMLNSGDIAQARLLLQRASDYGSAQAALLMGNSFDPNVLPWRPNMGLEAEPLKARQWYQHALSLGAGADATTRLAELPAPR